MKVGASFLILSIFLVIYFFDAATLRGFWITGDLGYSDLLDLNLPLKHILSFGLKNFRIPLWSNELLCGMPILAEGEGGFLNPINFLFFLFLPPLPAYIYSTLLIYIVAGLGIFLFSRKIGLFYLPSLFSSIVFIFSGFFICHLKHPAMIMTAAFFPFLFYFCERFIREGKLIFVLLAGIIFSFQVFAGHPQIMVYTNLVLFLYFICRFITIFLDERKKKKGNFLPLFLKVSFLPLMVIMGMALSAVQLLPTFELLKYSGRKLGEAIHELSRFPFHPKELINFILPYFYGDPALVTYKTEWNSLFWENTAYIGILPLIFAFVSLFWLRKNKYILIFLLSCLFFLLLSFGKYSPFLFLLKLPPLSSYRFPNRFLLLVDFSLVILAGFGIQMIIEKIKKLSIKTSLYILVIAITFLDLYRFGAHHNPTVPMSAWKKIPHSIQFLKEDKALFRVYSVGTIQSRNNLYYKYGWLKNKNCYVQNRETISLNTNAIYGLESPGVYLTLFPLRPFIFEMKLGGSFNLNGQNWTGSIPNETIKLLSLLNVKYLTSVFSLSGEGIELVKEIPMDWDLPHVKIYRNNNVLPRAFLVPSSKFVSDPNTIADCILNPTFNPKYEVILEESAPSGSFSISDSSCKIEDYKRDYVRVSCDMKGDGFLFLSDSHYPGWKAYIRNSEFGIRNSEFGIRNSEKETHIYYANCAFRAVFLNKGSYEVVFRYKPSSFYKGAIISIITLLLIICFVIKFKSCKF